MKVKITKENQNTYVIQKDKGSFRVVLMIKKKELNIVVEERDEEGHTALKYNASYDFLDLVNISKIFQIFSSVEEVYEGIKVNLEEGLFGINKVDQDIVISLFAFGKSTAELHVFLDSSQQTLHPKDQAKGKIILYEKSIHDLEIILEKVKKMIKEIKNETIIEEAEKDRIIKRISFVLRESEKIILKEEKDENHSAEKDLNETQPSTLDLKSFRLAGALNTQSGWVSSFIVLKDKRFACCSSEGIIEVFDQTTYDTEMKWKAHKEPIWNLSLLDDGSIISSSKDTTMKIWSLGPTSYTLVKTLQGHTECVSQSIQIVNSKIVSCSLDKTIKIWDKSSPECLKTLTGHKNEIRTLLQLSNKKQFVSAGADSIRLWGIENYECEKVLEYEECSGENCVVELKGKLILGRMCGISIIDLESFTFINKAVLSELTKVYSALVNGDNVLFGCRYKTGEKYSLVNVDINDLKILSNKIAHFGSIYSISQIDNHSFATTSFDESVKIWEL